MQKTEGVYWIITAYYFKQVSNTNVKVRAASDIIKAPSEDIAKNIFQNKRSHRIYIADGFTTSYVCIPLRGFYFDPANPPE